MSLAVQAFFHEPTSTYSYVVHDRQTRIAAVIDPVLDYDAAAGQIHFFSADIILNYIEGQALQVEWILETHAHADHLSAATYFQRYHKAKIGIGIGICSVQENFQAVFNLRHDFAIDGSQFDCLFKDSDRLKLGALEIRVMHTPGHTADSVTYIIGDAAFVGDTLFMPDYGTARCDFPGGNARRLYRSIQALFALPPDTRLYVCHDYIPDGSVREHLCNATVAEHRRRNCHLNRDVDEDAFVAMREARDRQLSMPALIIPAIQVNIRAGHLPAAEDNGIRYLKIPLNTLGSVPVKQS